MRRHSDVRTYGSMSFEKRKTMKKFVEDLEPDDLFEPTQSDWAAPSLLVPKKTEPTA